VRDPHFIVPEPISTRLPCRISLRSEVAYVIGVLSGSSHREEAEAFLAFFADAGRPGHLRQIWLCQSDGNGPQAEADQLSVV
jgi:hypothetical protein